MAVTKKDVETVANLARLYFTEEEKEELIVTLNNILNYFDKLSELDTADIEPLTHILDVQNVMREDEPVKSLDQKTALENSPIKQNGYFIVPRVIE